MNRAVYSFNDAVDKALFKPLAQGYRAVLPQFARTGVSNFFSNINDVLVALNNLLQAKVVDAVSDVGRVVVNTTIGLAGFFDVATHFGLEKHNEDFGQTLGRWGIGSGPYLVLPILGPSDFRDGLARIVDFKTDPLTYVRSISLRNSLWGVRAVSDRANLLNVSNLLDTASIDPYQFQRDAFLQRRQNLVYDGAPPRDDGDNGDEPAEQRKPDAQKPADPKDSDPKAGEPRAELKPDDATASEQTAAEAKDAGKTDAAAGESTAPAADANAAASADTPAAQPAPTVSADKADAAAAASPAPAPQVEPTAESVSGAQAEIVLPDEPTAAGGPALDSAKSDDQSAPQRVVRVWVAQ